MRNNNPQPLKEDITQDEAAKIKNGSGSIILGKCKRYWVFAFIIVINTIINFDHGYFPAATEEFKKEYDISSTLLGLFGSSVYLGNLLGMIKLK
jgi:hypothetical protein